MPIHDWTRVTAGTWHAFHLSWISEIQLALNAGLLPADYYAQAEQIAGPPVQDDIQPEAIVSDRPLPPPQTRWSSVAEGWSFAVLRRTIVVRRSEDDGVVGLLKMVPPAKRESPHAIRSFVEKAVEALFRGLHLLVIDLFPPGPRDPQGIHGAIWGEFNEQTFELPAGEPLTLAAYSSGSPKEAYVEPTAVGRELIEMPLFLEPDRYVNVPLEATYQAAYRGVARRWKQVLE